MATGLLNTEWDFHDYFIKVLSRPIICIYKKKTRDIDTYLRRVPSEKNFISVFFSFFF